MILIEKGIGKLKNISYYELKTIIECMPNDWGYKADIVYSSKTDEKFNTYNLKLYRKNQYKQK